MSWSKYLKRLSNSIKTIPVMTFHHGVDWPAFLPTKNEKYYTYFAFCKYHVNQLFFNQFSGFLCLKISNDSQQCNEIIFLVFKRKAVLKSMQFCHTCYILSCFWIHFQNLCVQRYLKSLSNSIHILLVMIFHHTVDKPAFLPTEMKNIQWCHTYSAFELFKYHVNQLFLGRFSKYLCLKHVMIPSNTMKSFLVFKRWSFLKNMQFCHSCYILSFSNIK